MMAEGRRGGKNNASFGWRAGGVWSEICPSRSRVSWLWHLLGACSSWKSMEHIVARHLPASPAEPFADLLPRRTYFRYSTHSSFSFPSLTWLRSLSLGCENSRVSPSLVRHQENVVLVRKMVLSLLCETAKVLHVVLALVTFERLNIANWGPFGVNWV